MPASTISCSPRSTTCLTIYLYTVLRMLITFIMRPACSPWYSSCVSLVDTHGQVHQEPDPDIPRPRIYLGVALPGHSNLRIVVKNILPQLISVIMLQTALCIPDAIGSEVFLTYIGLGLPSPSPHLATLLTKAVWSCWFPRSGTSCSFPVIVVSIITISFYALGNAFADASDPRNHRR